MKLGPNVESGIAIYAVGGLMLAFWLWFLPKWWRFWANEQLAANQKARAAEPPPTEADYADLVAGLVEEPPMFGVPTQQLQGMLDKRDFKGLDTLMTCYELGLIHNSEELRHFINLVYTRETSNLSGLILNRHLTEGAKGPKKGHPFFAFGAGAGLAKGLFGAKGL